ncbi:hypothetical protein ACFQZZ_24315 [Nocardia sp. GCM10030253]|uniref:hypothetical protein n=1 Tax=Nocardia sp. GCM10030253 TaxID=3273404 RepID=UPI0036361C87
MADLKATSEHFMATSGALVETGVAATGVVGTCAPAMAPVPCAIDPVSLAVADVFRSLAPRFCGKTIEGFAGSGKHFDAAKHLPVVMARYMGVDVFGGAMVNSHDANFRTK